MSEIKVDKLQGTSGSDTAITLSGANTTVGGTLVVTGIHTVGNNAIHNSDGGAVTQNLVQGLAKVWINISGTGTAAFRDSFNTSSFTDVGTGQYTTTFSNNMSNDDFSAPLAGQDSVQRGDVHTSFEAQTTSTLRIMHFEGAGSTDCNRIGAAVFGDLA